MKPIIEFEGIEKRFGRTVALSLDSLSLEAGTYNVILGPSGSGKTTLLRVAAGLESPDAGKVTIDGEDVTGKPAWKRGIGLVFQNYALYPHLTARENIALPLQVKGTKPEEAKGRVEELAAVMGLSEQLDKYPRQLSGGQQQRVALSRAIVKEPKLLLLDEPLSNLDARVRVELRGYLKELQRRLRITVLHVTHDQVEAMSLADRLVVLKDGRMVQAGEPREIYYSPVDVFVSTFIGLLNIVRRGAEGWSFPPGDYDAVGFRPESVKMGRQPEEGWVKGEVKLVEYSGPESMATVLVGDAEVKVRVDPLDEVAEGDAAYLSVDRSKLMAFKGERRVDFDQRARKG